MPSPNQLTYFTVTGRWCDVESPDPGGDTNAAQLLVVSGYIDFTPRLPAGTVAYVSNLEIDSLSPQVANTAIPIATITGRLANGVVSVVNRDDTPELRLLANSPVLNLSTLIYDVRFYDIVYANDNHYIANFAFTAPTTDTIIDLTDPALERLPYGPLIN